MAKEKEDTYQAFLDEIKKEGLRPGAVRPVHVFQKLHDVIEPLWENLRDTPSTFPPSTHTHDDRYYQESEVDALLAAQDAFLELADTPSSYTGEAGKFPKVKATEDGLEFSAGAAVSAFTDLTDTPAAYTGEAGKFVAVKGTEDGVEFIAGAAVADFTDLTDTPANYTSSGLKGLRVNSGASAVEFAEVLKGAYFGHRLSGQYYTIDSNCGNSLTTGNQSADQLRAYPFIVPEKTSFDLIAVNVTSGAAGGEKMRLGIYKSLSNGTPGALVVDSGEIASESSGEKSAVISETLEPGLYWLVHTANADQTLRVIARTYCLPLMGRNSTGAIYPSTCWNVARGFAALPDPFTGGGVTQEWSTSVVIYLKVA